MTTAATTKINYSDDNNNIAENTVGRSAVHEDDVKMNMNDQLAHIVRKFLDDDNIFDDDASFDSSDDEATIQRMKLSTKKMNSKPRSVVPVHVAAAAAPNVGNKRNENCADSGNHATIGHIHINKYNARWEEMYQRLVAYKKEHKNTRVPQTYNVDPKLGTWVHNQRNAYRDKGRRRNAKVS